MKQILSNRPLLINSWVFLLILSIFFPLRKVFFTSDSTIFGFYSDFTTISLYSSTILVLVGFFYAYYIKSLQTVKHIVPYYIILISIVTLSILYNYKSVQLIGFFYAWTILVGIVLHGTIASLGKYINMYKLAFYFIILVATEASLVIYQFAMQSSLGLNYFGESPLGLAIVNTAKVAVDGLSYLRGYGTFPHPNTASMFLGVGLIFCLFLYINSKKSIVSVFSLIVSGGTLVALILTFSRAGALAASLGLISYGIIALITMQNRQKVAYFGLFLVAVSCICVYSLRSLVLARADIKDPAITERRFLNKVGLKMVESSPVLGVGPSNSIIKLEDYSGKRLQSWEHQPIHNYFILTAAEAGLVASTVLIILIFKPFYALSRKIKTSNEAARPLSAISTLFIAVSVGILTLMLFDHYFYTLEQSRLLMWLFSGLALGFVLNNDQKTAPDPETDV